jgi:TPR repeat protein
MYAKGEGVIENDKKAVKWFRLAAEQGDAEAQNNLGTMYHNGEGVLQDNKKAHMWYNIARANGEKNTPLTISKALPEDILAHDPGRYIRSTRHG